MVLLAREGLGSIRACGCSVKALIALLMLAPLGCSSAADYDLYDLPTPPFEGGGGSTFGAGSNNGVDAAVCVVQGRAAVAGSLAATVFAAKDAIEVFDATKDTFTFEITDYAKACSLGKDVHASSNVVSITYADAALGSGTYDVTKTTGLKISYVRYDATCRPAATQAAASGTVTFGKLDACGGEGSFDLVFGTDHVTATFTASVCQVASGAPACK
jgi:hypothetical protein